MPGLQAHSTSGFVLRCSLLPLKVFGHTHFGYDLVAGAPKFVLSGMRGICTRGWAAIGPGGWNSLCAGSVGYALALSKLRCVRSPVRFKLSDSGHPSGNPAAQRSCRAQHGTDETTSRKLRFRVWLFRCVSVCV